VTFTSTKAGSYELQALIGTEAIPPEVATITFVAGDIDSDMSYLEAPNTTAVADGLQTLTVAAVVLDAYSNPVPDATVRFAIPQGVNVLGEQEGLEYFDVAVNPVNGKAEVKLVSTKAALYQVTAQAMRGVPNPKARAATDWQPINKNSPATVEFVAGDVDVTQSVISRTPDGPLTVGGNPDTYQVKVVLMDAYSNPVKVAKNQVQYAFFLSGPAGADPDAFCRQAGDADTKKATGDTDAEGEAVVPFTATKAGPWQGCAFYDGNPVVKGSPVDLAFQAGAASAETSVLEVSENLAASDGKAVQYGKVTVKDAFGNPIGGQEVTIGIEAGTDKVAGPNVKGATDLSATVKTCDPANSSNAPAYCTVEGVFQTGVAMVEFTSEEPGTFKVTGTLGGKAVSRSPLQVSFTAGTAEAKYSKWVIEPNTADPDTGADVSLPASGQTKDAYTVTVTARSNLGLLVPGARVRVDGLPAEVKLVGAVEGETAGPDSGVMGTFQWQLYSAVKGTYEGQVQLREGSQWVNVGGPFVVRFDADAPVAANSWLVQPEDALTAGGSTAIVAAHLFDANGNEADSGSVVFHVPDGVKASANGKEVEGPADLEVPVENGRAAIAVTSTVAGTHTVTADLGGEPITTVKNAAEDKVLRDNGEVQLVFGPAAVSSDTSTLTLPTADQVLTVGGTDKHRAEATIKDAYDNPIPGADVVFQWIVGDPTGPGAGSWNEVKVTSGADGVAPYEFAAPDNKAVWVWVRAYVTTANGNVKVGGAQTEPIVAEQTTLGAGFKAGAPDPDNTKATFETYSGAVLNNLQEKSWARVVVSDSYGNPVGGAPVTFTLPAGTKTPVFVDGKTPPEAKTFTVTTCEPYLTTVPAECLKDGAYTPGLALVSIVSAFEGTFPVAGTVGSGAGAIQVGPGDVVFSPGAPSAEKSWFTLEPTEVSPVPVVADGEDSYTLTVYVVSEVGELPVSGSCVTPQLSDGLTVVSAPPSGSCPDGQYPTDEDGKVVLLVVSESAGRAEVGVKLGDSSIPTESGGSDYSREVLFVGGPPSGDMSELTSPSAPVRADDPAGQVVKVTLRDAKGNVASCWSDEGDQIPCEAVLVVPAGTSVGSEGAVVTGPGVVTVESGLVDYSGVEPVSSASEVVYSGEQGNYVVTAKVGGADLLIADGVLSRGGPAEARISFTDATRPLPPIVDPSTGDNVTGSVADQDKGDAAEGDLSVVVTDEDGNVLGECPVDASGRFDCPLVPKPADGSEIEVTVKDKAGNESDPVTVVVDSKNPPLPKPLPTDGKEIEGDQARPGDQIVVKGPEGDVLCTTTVDAKGAWSCVLEPSAKEGDVLTVIAVGENGLTAERPWRVGIPRVEVEHGELFGGQEQVVNGYNFQPGELVDVVVDGVSVGKVVADGEGRVKVSWKVPADTKPGSYTVTASGPDSGTTQTIYKVKPRPVPPVVVTKLPFTGADGIVGLIGTAMGLALAGWLLLVAARRRRQSTAEEI
jgi:hypothetical protein